jgi:hypothetical protein
MATENISNFTQTWNSGGTTFYGIKMNVTDSASAADSRLMELQIGSAAKCTIFKTGDATLTSSDAGATAGPVLTLYRNSATPAASDIIGKVLFQGEDGAGNTEDYGEIYATITDPASGSEDASILIRAKSAGAMTTLLTLASDALTIPGMLDISGAAAGQIKFPSTQNASSNANTLDDYEEGTWTPTIVGITTAGTATYSTQTGRYTKMGRLVFVEFSVAWTGHTGVGTMVVDGLPFASGSGVSSPASLVFDSVTFANQVTGRVPNTTTYVQPVTMSTGAAFATLSVDAAGTITGGAFYTV